MYSVKPVNMNASILKVDKYFTDYMERTLIYEMG